MFAALSATNEAIMRAKSRTEMFELVCKAAAQGGRFNSTSILLARPDSDYSRHGRRRRADRGQRPSAEGFDRARRVRKGAGSAGRRSVTRQACITNDFLGRSARRRVHRSVIQSEGARSGAAFPLLVDGQPVGVMLFISSETRHLHGGIRRIAAAAGRQRLLRARKLRSRRREGEDRGAEGAVDAHVRGAQRHQRSDHAGQVPNGAVRTGLRGRDRRRQFHLDGNRSGSAGRRFPAKTSLPPDPIGSGPARCNCRPMPHGPKGRASPASRSVPASLASATTI